MSHVLDSIWLFIHPPLAIIGYFFIITTIIIISSEKINKIIKFNIKKMLYAAWFFNLCGLITGMIWANMAWGSLWSWDPKETITLFIFISVSISTLQYDKRNKISLLFMIIALILIIINIMISIGAFGLHSYNLIKKIKSLLEL